MNHFTPILYKI
jgi:hypothetical protein